MIFRYSEDQKKQLKKIETALNRENLLYLSLFNVVRAAESGTADTDMDIFLSGNGDTVTYRLPEPGGNIVPTTFTVRDGKIDISPERLNFYKQYQETETPRRAALLNKQFSDLLQQFDDAHMESLKTPAEVLQDAETTAKDGLYAAFLNDCKNAETDFTLKEIDPDGDGITADGLNPKETAHKPIKEGMRAGLHLLFDFTLKPFNWNYAAEIDDLKEKETPPTGAETKDLLQNPFINPPIYEDREGAYRWITQSVIDKHLSYLKKNDYPKYKKALQDVRNLLKKTPFVRNPPESAAYWKQIDAANKQTKKLEKATKQKIITDKTDTYLPSFHGRGTNDLLQVDAKRVEKRTRQDEIADRAILPTESGEYRLIVSNFSSLKSVSINIHKLLSMAVAELTAQNNYSKAGKSDRAKLRVYIPLTEYMHRVYPSTEINTNAADPEAETRRAKNAEKYARKEIKKDLQFLYDSGAAWTEKVKGQEYTTDGAMRYISGYQIKGGAIQIEFSQSMAEYLLKLPENQYATWLLRIDSHKPNAYRLGLKLVEHSNMDNNIIKGTANRLQVSTVLKYVKLPTFESLQGEKKDNGRQWEQRIKEPLESCLDELQAAGGLSDWQYVKPGGIPLTDEEAESITDYHTWENLLIEFQLKGAPDHTERLKRRAEQKKKTAAKKAAKKRKKGEE